MLTGKPIPNWVNRLAALCIRFPFIAACIPKEWLTPEDPTFPHLDLSEWEQIDTPETRSTASMDRSGEFRTESIGSPSYEFQRKCFEKSGGENEHGTDDHMSEKVSLKQMMGELHKQPLRKSVIFSTHFSKIDFQRERNVLKEQSIEHG